MSGKNDDGIDSDCSDPVLSGLRGRPDAHLRQAGDVAAAAWGDHAVVPGRQLHSQPGRRAGDHATALDRCAVSESVQ